MIEIELDKLHEECGVVAVYGNPEAAKLCYLGLHALQHRGQESAGIAASDGRRMTVYKSMGLVADIFNEAVLAKLTGSHAIGHTRYSTAGDSALLNAQPIQVDCNKGRIAIAHNGNLVNATELRKRFELAGSIFQTSSDTEIVLHLIAQSHETTLPDAIADALRRIEGAFSFVMATTDHVFAARDPRGFRPLAMGRIPGSDGQQGSIVFASETCAFDLLGAYYERDVKPGELVVVGPEGVHSHFYAPALAQSQCVFEQVYFARPDSLVFGKSVQESREQMGRQLAREAPVEADLVVGVPDSGLTAALGYARESGIPMQFGLVRNHYVGRTFIEPEQRVRDFGVRLKLNPGAAAAGGQAGDSDRRLDCARHHQPEDRAHGARCGGARGPYADLLSSHDFTVLLRSGYARAAAPDRGAQVGGRGAGVYRRRFPGLSFAGRIAGLLRRTAGRIALLHLLLHRKVSDQLRGPA